MKGLVKYAHGDGNMEIRDVAEPHPGSNEVRIEVKAAGVCGSDLHIYHDDIAIPLKPPVVIGHEFSGVITEIGSGVEGWKIGDRVTSETACEYCGTCHYCRTGFFNLCGERRVLGYWYDGAFAKYTVVPQRSLHALPKGVDFLSGALMEPLACVVHAVLELTSVTTGNVVLVSGPGAIGLATLQVVKSQGAIVVVFGAKSDTHRLKKARELGADHAIDTSGQDLQALVTEITNDMGADVVFECSGAPGAVSAGLEAVKKQGHFTQIGLFGKPITLDFERICYKELVVTGSMGSDWPSWKTALQLVARKKIDLSALVSHEIPLEEWRRAFELFERRDGLKLVLRPS